MIEISTITTTSENQYYLRTRRVRHDSGICQESICVKQREITRINPRIRYRNHRYCSSCCVHWPKDVLRCPHCSHILRNRSKYTKDKEKECVRY